MFAYGICAGKSGKVDSVAVPSIRRLDPDAKVHVLRGQRSIHEAYNTIMDSTAGTEDLEGLVLLHDDTSIQDARFEERLRRVLSDDSVGIVGVIGGIGHEDILWWQGQMRGRTRDNQSGLMDFGGGLHPVDTVDGLLLVLSPWVVDNLRFDVRRYSGFHGYDAEICAQARAAGKQVVVADLDVFHDNKLHPWYGDLRSLLISSLTWQLKWRNEPAVRRAMWRVRRAALRAGLPARVPS